MQRDMQQAAQHDGEAWISQSECARLVGRHRSTIARQVKTGAVRARADGRVRLSEVMQDRDRNVALWRSNRRQGARDFEDEPAPADNHGGAVGRLAGALLDACPAIVAKAMLEAGCRDTAMVCAAARIFVAEARDDFENVLRRIGVDEDARLDMRHVAGPDWAALATAYGFQFDEAAAENYESTLAYWAN